MAVSRAYFAMFYAASATLRSQNIRRAKHSGVIAAFGQCMVKTGRFPVEHHVALQTAFSSRGAGTMGESSRIVKRLKGGSKNAFVEAVADFFRNEGISF